jgi:hypothetical protein
MMTSGMDLSTWEGDGDSSSESTRSQYGIAFPAPQHEQTLSHVRGRSPAAGSTRELAVHDDDEKDDDDDDDDAMYADQDEMPSTREPSPEPMWNRANQYGCEYVSHGNQVFLIPRTQVPHMKQSPMMPTWPNYAAPYGEPSTEHRPSLTPPPGDVLLPAPPPAPQPLRATQASRSRAPEPTTNSKKREEVGRLKSGSKAKGQGSKKSNGKTRGEGSAKGDALSNMSEENKQALAKYIYDFMVDNEFTSPDGYLLVDVLAEVWKDMGDCASGGRIAQHRFAELLRGAPQHFELFRKGIRVTNHCGWFARKGEKMVRLVQTSA